MNNQRADVEENELGTYNYSTHTFYIREGFPKLEKLQIDTYIPKTVKCIYMDNGC